MKCDQARDMLLDRLDGIVPHQPAPDLDQHLNECPACQAWYRQQQLAAEALEKLTPIPVSDGFTARVLAQLPQRTFSQHPARQEPKRRIPTWRRAWADLVASLSSPMGRRRLAPAFVTVAAALAVAVCLFAMLQGAGIPPVTPGAATGSLSWPVLAGGIIVIVLAVVGLLFLRRK